ncbi:MAG: Conserved hypothetical integral membrane protein YrbEa, partial [uncultured Nocardioidaceae bacterium]
GHCHHPGPGCGGGRRRLLPVRRPGREVDPSTSLRDGRDDPPGLDHHAGDHRADRTGLDPARRRGRPADRQPHPAAGRAELRRCRLGGRDRPGGSTAGHLAAARRGRRLGDLRRLRCPDDPGGGRRAQGPRHQHRAAAGGAPGRGHDDRRHAGHRDRHGGRHRRRLLLQRDPAERHERRLRAVVQGAGERRGRRGEPLQGAAVRRRGRGRRLLQGAACQGRTQGRGSGGQRVRGPHLPAAVHAELPDHHGPLRARPAGGPV